MKKITTREEVKIRVRNEFEAMRIMPAVDMLASLGYMVTVKISEIPKDCFCKITKETHKEVMK